MIRLFFVLIGFSLAVIGGVSMLAYLNLLTTGYNSAMYFMFLLQRIEFYFFIIGVMIIIGAMTVPMKQRNRRKKR
ncbi:hypothetical protein JCM9140_1265 [Halalkalibacter wakoensis JCM 9140]|uniref:Uncharacterized protein n=1 Tax=Halalkalibacter wakoensis JCM 9140 TaxID=1236970 RepID=W4PZW5_9BACI|nr:hypothetical protein [Halalkalibacter wakoensis]GAE25282.1 hypothetical protein JCM9140_1265 [Halalkalibacter wakoensis JCM 9140]